MSKNVFSQGQSERLTIQISGGIAKKLKEEKREFDKNLGAETSWTVFMSWREKKRNEDGH